MSVFVGVDPDLRTTAIAGVDEHGVLVHASIVEAKGARQEEQVTRMVSALRAHIPWMTGHYHYFLAVEAQTMAMHHTRNPRDIMHLAQVAGACLAVGSMTLNVAPERCFFPPPRKWKGDVPKGIHQARICRTMGWEYEKKGGKTPKTQYCVPKNAPIELRRASDWKHVMDAVGIACWLRALRAR